ncbi:MAG: hypothetical protein O7F70_10400, partial [Gemmatimonadetes bacterium]|nr:hypothetical protein [Gemmatimonadota bacterium]
MDPLTTGVRETPSAGLFPRAAGRHLGPLLAATFHRVRGRTFTMPTSMTRRQMIQRFAAMAPVAAAVTGR